MAFGITLTGYVTKTLTDIKATLQTGYRGVFGNTVNLDDRTRNGQTIALFADALAEVWSLGEALSNALNPFGATGVLLDNVSALTGTYRKAATKSVVTLTATGTAATLLPTGRIASVSTTAAKFITTAPATIAAASAWATSSPYSIGARVAANSNIYQATTGGVSAAAGTGPSGTGTGIVDNTVVWVFLGVGLGVIDVPAEATVTGPVQGYARTINTIDTAVSGWNNVINVLDAVAGTDRELDSAMRTRRFNELGGQGKSPVDSIRANILRVDGVTACVVFQNPMDATVDGIGPHGVEALVEGGSDVAIRAAIFGAVAGGIQTYGNTSGTVVDSSGNSHTVVFSRPVLVNIYAKVTLIKDPNTYPEDGDQQVKAQIVAIENARALGKDVVGSQLGADAFLVTGVLDVTQVLLSTSPSPTLPTTIAISPRQRAVHDTSRITVVTSDGVP